jgi:hypothetical protein
VRKIGLWILFLIFSVNAFSADFTLTHLSKGEPGNNRYPGICENGNGERLAIWRSGNNRGMLFTYFKDGTWSNPAPIPNQTVKAGEYLGSDIVVDSENRFHVVWELMEKACFYATFMDGVWTDPVKVPWPARYWGFQIGLDIRSNDEVVVIACVRYGIYKDIGIGFLKKGEKNFSHFKNLTDDKESSSSPMVAVDANDHLWVNYKGEVFGLGEEVLDACMMHLDQNNDLVDFADISKEQGSWAFLEWDAANKTTGVVMATWWARKGYWSRWYNQATEQWSPITSIGVGSERYRDFSMWNKVVAQGKDFYCLAKTNGHKLYIVKFNGETETWEKPIPVYDKPTVYCDLYPANGNIDIAFSTRDEPTQVYFTSMVGSYEPPKIKVKSAVNVLAETQMERSFFSGFYFNQVTWENNPWNIENEVAIDYFNLYRKLKTEAEYGPTPYQANIPASQFYFDDKSGIEETPLYDYAVTCVTTVNGEQVESKIEY